MQEETTLTSSKMLHAEHIRTQTSQSHHLRSEVLLNLFYREKRVQEGKLNIQSKSGVIWCISDRGQN